MSMRATRLKQRQPKAMRPKTAPWAQERLAEMAQQLRAVQAALHGLTHSLGVTVADRMGHSTWADAKRDLFLRDAAPTVTVALIDQAESVLDGGALLKAAADLERASNETATALRCRWERERRQRRDLVKRLDRENPTQEARTTALRERLERALERTLERDLTPTRPTLVRSAS